MEILAVSVPVGLHQQQATGIRPAHLLPPFLSLPRFTDSTDSVVTSFNSDLNFLFLAKTNEKINTVIKIKNKTLCALRFSSRTKSEQLTALEMKSNIITCSFS